jgi:hypothetical protein
VMTIAECCNIPDEVADSFRWHNVRLGDVLDVEGGVPDLQLLHPPPPDTTDRGVCTERTRRRRRRRTIGIQATLGGRCNARQRLAWPY